MPASTPLISVAVIFHNAAATLDETLRSLAANAARGVEFIFIDDGSTDTSADIVRRFIKAAPDARRLISVPERGGTAAATAKALGESTGEYVMRCDADDTLEAGALALLAETATRTRADIIAAPMIYDYRRDGRSYKERIVSVDTLSLNDMPIDTAHFGLPNKLIRRSLLMSPDMLPFEGIDRWEDLGVMTRILALHPRVAILDRPTYRYIRRDGVATLSADSYQKILDDHIAMARQLDEWLADKGLSEEYEPFLQRLKLIAKVKLLRHRPRRLRQWQATFPEANRHILRVRHIPLRYRILMALAARL